MNVDYDEVAFRFSVGVVALTGAGVVLSFLLPILTALVNDPFGTAVGLLIFVTVAIVCYLVGTVIVARWDL